VELDAPPHVIADQIGLRLADPAPEWGQRPDMDPVATRPFRASIVARARFIEDLVTDEANRGVRQYVILGAGLDTFAQRRQEVASRLTVFEVDKPAHQTWKRERLRQTGYGIPAWLRLVPVDFEAGDSWRDHLATAGFDAGKPAVVVSTGVTMYLTREANLAALRDTATLAAGSTFATTFILPLDLAEADVRPGLEMAAKGAASSGTPFISYFTPDDMLALARQAGFHTVQHISAATLAERYFAGRPDGLRPPNNAEELIVART
jgi:methyltransferase (TIGR00027 family)